MNKVKLYRWRRAIGRLLSILIVPTVVYIITTLGSDYCPPTWWIVITLVLMTFELWGLYYSEFFFKFKRKKSSDETIEITKEVTVSWE